MEAVYVISQIFVVMQYACLITTYQLKTNKQILLFNTIAGAFAMLSFLCLGAYSGCVMSLLSIFRNYLFYQQNNEKKVSSLILVLTLLFILTIFTYDGIFTLMPAIGTTLYTLSVWQKDTKTYKKFGLIIESSWFIYHIYVKSIFGIILEGISFISVIIGIIREKKNA